ETGLHFSGSCPGAVRGRGLALGAAKGHIESMSGPAIPERAPAATSADDTILPFAVETLDLRGRVVRLGPAVDTILRNHAYPSPVAKLLGEAIVLTVMLGSVLKFEGRFILQTQTDGPVRMLVVDFRTPGNVRACARFDKERVAAAIAAGPRRAPSSLTPPSPRRSTRARTRAAIRAWLRSRARISNMRRTNISSARSKSRPECASPSAKRSAGPRTALAIAGVPAASCCN